MKKRVSTRAICLLVASVILAGALTVSAINGSPYENLKNAVFNALFYENVTLEAEMTLRIDGQVHESGWIREYVGDESRLTFDMWERNWQQEDGAPVTFVGYETRYLNIGTVITSAVDGQWYRVSRNHRAVSNNSMAYEMFGISAADRNSNQVRLVELFVDLLVGDLKNNLTISSQGDGVRRVSGAITESQLPEIARVAIAVAIDEQLRWVNTDTVMWEREDFDNILSRPITGLTINRISGDADIDNYGNLLYIHVLGHVTIENIFGDSHEVEVEARFRFSDIGTTVPDSPFPCVDIFVELFEADNIATGGWGRWSMYFTRDDDGNIDLDSIGSRPGSQDHEMRNFFEELSREHAAYRATLVN